MPGAEVPTEERGLPRIASRRGVVTFAIAVILAVGLVYFGLPRLAGLNDTLDRLRDADWRWVVVAVGFELLSFLSYVVLFRSVFLPGAVRIDWRASYQITMAGLAATRLFAAGGAGGVALTYWALRRAGMGRRLVVARLLAFMVLLYGVYMFALVIDGVFLRTGLLRGNAPWGLTILPAAVAGAVILIFIAFLFVPPDLEERIERRLVRAASEHRRLARLMRRLSTVPATLSRGTRTALELIKGRHPGLLGAIGWWAFDIAVLWASFHAFGEPPNQAVIVMAYFVGMAANLLPFFPGGVGSVEAGMIAAFVGFGTSGSLAVVAVLTYRTIAFWLPTVPGVIAYIQLRRTVNRWDEALA